MTRGTRKCLVCGKTYVYCPSCGKGDPKETWRYLYDTEDCHKIFNTVSGYRNGHFKADAALNTIDKLTKGKTLTPDFAAEVAAITAETAKTVPEAKGPGRSK